MLVVLTAATLIVNQPPPSMGFLTNPEGLHVSIYRLNDYTHVVQARVRVTEMADTSCFAKLRLEQPNRPGREQVTLIDFSPTNARESWEFTFLVPRIVDQPGTKYQLEFGHQSSPIDFKVLNAFAWSFKDGKLVALAHDDWLPIPVYRIVPENNGSFRIVTETSRISYRGVIGGTTWTAPALIDGRSTARRIGQ